MIVCQVQLHSAIDGRTDDLGTLIIDNVGGTRTHCDYRVRMYRKGDAERVGGVRRLPRDGRPIREGKVLRHARLREPVHNLVAKALAAMGYGETGR